MKKVIQGKVYDTDTAKFQADYDNGYAVNDFNHYSESLYLKKTGEYFLHCEGGGLSPYGQQYGDSWGWGETIKPLSYDEAKAWAEEKLDGDEYEEKFGVVEEEGEVGIAFQIEKNLKNKIDQHTQRQGLGLREYIVGLIEDDLN